MNLRHVISVLAIVLSVGQLSACQSGPSYDNPPPYRYGSGYGSGGGSSGY